MAKFRVLKPLNVLGVSRQAGDIVELEHSERIRLLCEQRQFEEVRGEPEPEPASKKRSKAAQE